MAGDIRFDGRVAIITGAGGGLGKSHALELAKRAQKMRAADQRAHRTTGNHIRLDADFRQLLLVGRRHRNAVENGIDGADRCTSP